MASSKLVMRLSSRLQAIASKLSGKSLSPELCSPKFNPRTSRLSSSTRNSNYPWSPVLRSDDAFAQRHSAIASARLISSLTTDSQSWGLVPQGISIPL